MSPTAWSLAPARERKRKGVVTNQGSPQSLQTTLSPSISEVRDNAVNTSLKQNKLFNYMQDNSHFSAGVLVDGYVASILRHEALVWVCTLVCSSANERIILTQSSTTWNRQTDSHTKVRKERTCSKHCSLSRFKSKLNTNPLEKLPYLLKSTTRLTS